MFTAGFSTFALLYCVQPLMPILSKDFGQHAATTSLVLSLATIALAVGLIFTGPVSDAIGRKSVMVAALLGASLFTLVGAFMPSWHGLLAMRILVGLSLSGLVAVAMTYLSEEIHPKDLGFAMGLYIGGNAIGGMLGRLIVGVMVDYFTWRTALVALGVLSLFVTLLFWKILPPSRHFHPTPRRLSALAAGYALHLKDAALPWLFLEGFLLMGSFVTLFNYISYRLLAAPYCLSQSLVGSVSAVYVAGIYSSPSIGALADKLGRRRVLWVVASIMLAGVLVTLASPLWAILLGLLLFSFGFFGAHSVSSSWIGRRARQARGQASSLYLLCYYIGGSLAGTTGGFFWHDYGWTGLGLFIASLLAAAVLVAVRLIRVPPLSG
jgi:YNFM family putative membrane transporter